MEEDLKWLPLCASPFSQVGWNELPQSKPTTLCFSLELCRYAKGPISEGAVAVGDWGSSLGSA